MARLNLSQLTLVVLALLTALSARAQAGEDGAAVSLAFTNELGEGKFRTALSQNFTEHLTSDRRAASETGSPWFVTLSVKTLSEHAAPGGATIVEAVVVVALLDSVTGRARFARTVRTTYPARKEDAVERLGEAAGQRLARTLCEAACARLQRPQVARPKRIISESDW